MSFVIDVQGLNKSFGETIAVNNLSLQVKKGEIFGFLGPNGSGKTTTIRMLCGLLTPDAGIGHCLSHDILTESALIKRQVGYMTQRFSLYEDLTILENMNFIAGLYELPNRKKRVDEAIVNLGLEERKNQLAGKLSGGWKQRLALATALLHKPKLLLLDEPTAGVDPKARRDFWDTLHHLSDQGITTLVSTHYMDEAERCHRLAYIAYGHLLVQGTTQEVIQQVGLTTWLVTGANLMTLAKQLEKLPGVAQVVAFCNGLHVCGKNPQQLQAAIQPYWNEPEIMSPVASSDETARAIDAHIPCARRSSETKGDVILGSFPGAGKIDLKDMAAAIFDNASFDVFQWTDSIVQKQPRQIARILGTLRATGVEPPLILWALARECRKSSHSQLLQRAHQIDLMIKGAKAGNVWDELLQLGLVMAGVSVC